MSAKNFIVFKFFFLALIILSSCSTARRTAGNNDGLTKEQRKRMEVVSYAKEFLGTSYKYGGTTPKGFDCSGFTSHVLRKFGVTMNRMARDQAKQGRKIDVRRANVGDLIFFKRRGSGKIFHVALVVDHDRTGLTVVHSTSRGVIRENISQSSYWEPKIYAARDVLSR